MSGHMPYIYKQGVADVDAILQQWYRSGWRHNANDAVCSCDVASSSSSPPCSPYFLFVLRPCGILLGMRKYLDVSMHIASSLIDLYRLFRMQPWLSNMQYLPVWHARYTFFWTVCHCGALASHTAQVALCTVLFCF